MMNMIFLNEVMSAIDSFQQDYGTFHYSITISSYALHHQLMVTIIDTKNNKAIRFCIKETNYTKAVVPSRYIYNLIKEKSEELANKRR